MVQSRYHSHTWGLMNDFRQHTCLVQGGSQEALHLLAAVLKLGVPSSCDTRLGFGGSELWVTTGLQMTPILPRDPKFHIDMTAG